MHLKKAKRLLENPGLTMFVVKMIVVNQNKKKCIPTILILLGLMNFNNLNGQGPPTFSDTPILLGLEGRGIRTFFEIAETESGKSSRIIMAVPYNITRNFQLGFVVPLIFQNPELLEKRTGIGDAAIFLKYVIHQQDFHKKTFRTLVKLTQVFPTGDELPETALGTGNFQTHLSIVSGFITTKWGLYIDAGYGLLAKSMSNRVSHNISFVFPIMPQEYPPKQINVSLALNGNYDLDDSYNELLISPGIQLIPGKKILLETGIKLPVSSHLNSKDLHYIFNIGSRILLF